MRLYFLLEIIENYKKNLEKKSEKSGKSLKKFKSPGKKSPDFRKSESVVHFRTSDSPLALPAQYTILETLRSTTRRRPQRGVKIKKEFKNVCSLY